MVAGLGYFDANGIWQYGEADTDVLFSDLLNTGMQSVSDQLVLDRARLDDLEQDTGWVDITLRPGFGSALLDPPNPQVRRRGSFVVMRGGFSNEGISSGGTYTVGDVPVGFRPPITTGLALGSNAGVYVASARINSNGTIELRPGSSTGTYYFFSAASWYTD